MFLFKKTRQSSITICSLLGVFILFSPVAMAKDRVRGKHKLADKGVAEKYSNISGLRAAINSFLPQERIVIHTIKNTIVLSGAISSVEAAGKAERLVREFYGEHAKMLNFMQIKGGQQVMLRVRVGEVKRLDLKETRVTMQNTSYDSMEQRGIIKTVAEPNLVAMSGERAEFLAGGEFPVPTVQKEGNISVNYKTYGVKVVFTPLVLANNKIRLSVEPEVSELSKDGSISVQGFQIPSVASRRAKTTVELAPGESFMIAGLVKDDLRDNRRDGTELVISVAPYLVDPINNKDVRMPTDSKHIATQLETKFIDKIGARYSRSSDTHSKSASHRAGLVEGPVGFIAE